MQKKHWRMLTVLLLVILSLLPISGCSKIKDAGLMKSYGEFMKTKYDEVDREVTTIKDQLFTMTWTSWMDDAWLTETRNDLQSLSSTLGEIVHYDETKVPEKFSGIHRNLVSIATRSRSVVDKYITGIDNRDLGALTEASIKLASLSGELSSFQNKIDQMLPE